MKYDLERAVVCISVRELCSLAYLRGNLDLRIGKSKPFSPERAAIGSAIHRRLQKEAGIRYEAEFPLTHTAFYRGISFEVSGRADGVIRAELPLVDEIKSVSGKAFELPPTDVHKAQLRCYAYMLCRQLDVSQIQTRLTYVRLEDEAAKSLTEVCTEESLRSFFEGLLERIFYRAQILIEHETLLVPSARRSRFPYPTVREGQDIMLRECFRDIRAGKRLFIEAPTGTGKTVSALFPAVQALGKGFADKIFYLTAKASTRREAFHAAAQIFDGGAHLRTIVLHAREQLCKNELAKADPLGISRHCNPLDCPLAKGFFDRVGNACCDALQKQSGFQRGAVESVAQSYHLCPYEFQLELSLFCDVIICDYNYVFDPQVYLRRYFEPDAAKEHRYVFLIDEAHNLGDRACDMYSAELSSLPFLALKTSQEVPDADLERALESVLIPMEGFSRLCKETLTTDESGIARGYYLSKQPNDAFLSAVAEARKRLEAWLHTHATAPLEGEVYRLISLLKRFEVISECYDERFLTFLTVEGAERRIRLVCLDPSAILASRLARAHASVLFSATMTPLDYFADILGGEKGAIRVSLPSAFPTSNLCVAAVTGVSTRYEDRAKSYKNLVSYLAASISGKKGNYIVYFPSYDYMQQVLELFSKKYPSIETVVQTKGMSHADKDAFLDAFQTDGTLRLGFCVLGGSFSEGVDLPGNRLIGSIIVGTGIPGISSERNILREYYDNTRENGYDYAYTYPGMNRVLQAAGRVIRSETDRGIVVLIDDRYATDRYKALLPEHWEQVDFARNSYELAEIVKNFWKKSGF